MGHVACFLDAAFPASANNLGIVQLQSSQNIAAVGLQFGSNDAFTGVSFLPFDARECPDGSKKWVLAIDSAAFLPR